MAKLYCSALCNLSGMCEFFMTTDDSNCPHGCNVKHSKGECIFFAIIACLHLKSIDLKKIILIFNKSYCYNFQILNLLNKQKKN